MPESPDHDHNLVPPWPLGSQLEARLLLQISIDAWHRHNPAQRPQYKALRARKGPPSSESWRPPSSESSRLPPPDPSDASCRHFQCCFFWKASSGESFEPLARSLCGPGHCSARSKGAAAHLLHACLLWPDRQRRACPDLYSMLFQLVRERAGRAPAFRLIPMILRRWREICVAASNNMDLTKCMPKICMSPWLDCRFEDCRLFADLKREFRFQEARVREHADSHHDDIGSRPANVPGISHADGGPTSRAVYYPGACPFPFCVTVPPCVPPQR
jgi:hypothetical protein